MVQCYGMLDKVLPEESSQNDGPRLTGSPAMCVSHVWCVRPSEYQKKISQLECKISTLPDFPRV